MPPSVKSKMNAPFGGVWLSSLLAQFVDNAELNCFLATQESQLAKIALQSVWLELIRVGMPDKDILKQFDQAIPFV